MDPALVASRVGLNLNFEFECAHELLINLNSTFAKSMSLNLNSVFAKSMNLNLVIFLKSMNLNVKIKNKMKGSNPGRKLLFNKYDFACESRTTIAKFSLF